MVKIYVIIGFAIPSIIALAIVIPMLTQPEIPFSAANPKDRIEIEYTKHHLLVRNDGIIQRTVPQKTEILEIKNDGSFKYYVINEFSEDKRDVTVETSKLDDITGKLDERQMKRLTAIMKETGFVAIPTESFKVMSNVTSYEKTSIKVTLNGVTSEIRWPEQNATSQFIPPIITLVKTELDKIIEESVYNDEKG